MFDRLPRNLATVLETKFRLILFDLSELVSYQILKHLIFLFLLLIPVWIYFLLFYMKLIKASILKSLFLSEEEKD